MSFFSQIAASASKAATELGGHAKTMGNNILATENGKNMYSKLMNTESNKQAHRN